MSRETTGGGGGSNAGAPTLTTPTLTPTTLRNIEQMFADRDPHEPPPHHENAAGFVPPIIRLATTTGVWRVLADFLSLFQSQLRSLLLRPGFTGLPLLRGGAVQDGRAAQSQQSDGVPARPH